MIKKIALSVLATTLISTSALAWTCQTDMGTMNFSLWTGKVTVNGLEIGYFGKVNPGKSWDMTLDGPINLQCELYQDLSGNGYCNGTWPLKLTACKL